MIDRSLIVVVVLVVDVVVKGRRMASGTRVPVAGEEIWQCAREEQEVNEAEEKICWSTLTVVMGYLISSRLR